MSSTASRRPGFAAAVLLFALFALPGTVSAANHVQITGVPTGLANLTLGTLFPSYSVIELGSFGGTNCCNVTTINNIGWVNGTSNLPGDQNFHPFLWVNGKMIDLGTLGGPNASVGGMNDLGAVTVGPSDTGVPDPLGEDPCHFGTYQTCRSYVWYDGKRTLIPTIGGNSNDVSGINNNGQVLVAEAETAFHDPTCIPPQVLGIEAFIWEPKKRQIQVLAPLPGDSATAAFGMNENGQAVGTSGICADNSFASAHHVVLWQNGRPTNLGNLGGRTGNLAFGINNRGQVVGVSDLPGDATGHAFLWQNGILSDLGTLPGDFSSNAGQINDRGQIAAQSCDVNFNCRAAIWQNGVMTDLNALIPSHSPLLLMSASFNARGEIVGAAFDQRTGATVPYLAIPRVGVYLTQAQVLARTHKIMLPERVRKMLQRRRGFAPFQDGIRQE